MRTNPVKKASTAAKKPTLADLAASNESLTRANAQLTIANEKLEATQHQLVLEVLDRLISKLNRVNSDRETGGMLDYRELCRALLLSRDRCDAAVSLAIRRYIDVLTDQRQLMALVRQHDIAAPVLYKMLHRYLVYHRQDLEALGVDVQEVAKGVTIDPAVHNVVAKKAALRLEDVDKVADCVSPLLTWSDSTNTPQLRAADVVAFVEVAEDFGVEGKSGSGVHKPEKNSASKF